MSDFKRKEPGCGWPIYIMKKKPPSGARFVEDSCNR